MIELTKLIMNFFLTHIFPLKHIELQNKDKNFVKHFETLKHEFADESSSKKNMLDKNEKLNNVFHNLQR